MLYFIRLIFFPPFVCVCIRETVVWDVALNILKIIDGLLIFVMGQHPKQYYKLEMRRRRVIKRTQKLFTDLKNSTTLEHFQMLALTIVNDLFRILILTHYKTISAIILFVYKIFILFNLQRKTFIMSDYLVTRVTNVHVVEKKSIQVHV